MTDRPQPKEPLAAYRRKRDFAQTPEPPPGPAPAGRGSSFVVQKHDASRLHYDFRLEVDGVLKSWAIPKGPSLDPSDKRLAVPTEDHPLSYGSFEGVIPEGQYGGGAVLLWDRGTYEAEGDPTEGLREGKLSFVLHGEKLRGGFSLVRMRGDDQWLLIKKNDQHADRGGAITTDRPESVLGTGALEDVVRAGTGALPESVEPTLCRLYEVPPEGDGWLHELKLDGYRSLCRIEGGEARFLSRNGVDWTEKVGPAIRDAAVALAESAWLDGELVVFDPEGLTRLRAVRSAIHGGDRRRIRYMVFDLLFLDGVDLRERPLAWRKAELERLLEGQRRSSPIRYVDHVRGQGGAMFEQACASGAEGIIAKRADSHYEGQRTAKWRKIRCHRKDELVVIGYVPSTANDDAIGSLVLATRDEEGQLVYAGRVGSGFTDDARAELRALLDRSKRETPPVDDAPRVARGKRQPVWVEPTWVAEVQFTEWTAEGRLRHPVYQGLREDKGPAEVTRERPAKRPRVVATGIELTNPDKVLYPKAGLTKRDLAEYVASVADRMLPHVARRPLTLFRCPDGIGEGCFFQKHAMPGLPRAVKTIAIAEKKGKGDYLWIDDAEGLLALVQLGCVELHVWGSRIDRPERPDRIVFDLDPAKGLGFDAVVRGARETRDLLETLGLRSFPMLTGGKGVHVVVPLERRHDFDEVKGFSEALAKRMASSDPKRYLAKASKAAREGRIFIDYLRNGRGATAVVPYSMRARAGAPVAVPVRWDELGAAGGGDRYHVGDLARRLGALGSEPWEGYDTTRQRITKAAMRALALEP